MSVWRVCARVNVSVSVCECVGVEVFAPLMAPHGSQLSMPMRLRTIMHAPSSLRRSLCLCCVPPPPTRSGRLSGGVRYNTRGDMVLAAGGLGVVFGVATHTQQFYQCVLCSRCLWRAGGSGCVRG